VDLHFKTLCCEAGLRWLQQLGDEILGLEAVQIRLSVFARRQEKRPTARRIQEKDTGERYRIKIQEKDTGER